MPWGLATVKVAGTRLFEQGDTQGQLFLLEEGLVKLSCALPDGQQALLSLGLPGQLLGGTCVPFLGESYPVSARPEP